MHNIVIFYIFLIYAFNFLYKYKYAFIYFLNKINNNLYIIFHNSNNTFFFKFIFPK